LVFNLLRGKQRSGRTDIIVEIGGDKIGYPEQILVFFGLDGAIGVKTGGKNKNNYFKYNLPRDNQRDYYIMQNYANFTKL